MKYKKLLRARSLTRDYRWFFYSDHLSKADRDLIKELFDLYISAYGNIFEQLEIEPFYLIKFSRAIAVIKMRFTGHKERGGRKVFALEGITVERKYSKELWSNLYYLLTLHKKTLEIWEGLIDQTDLLGMDDYRETLVEDDTTFNLQTDPPSYKELNYTPPKIFIPFDTKGLSELEAITISENFPFMQIAFGATDEILRLWDFDIIGKVSYHPQGASLRNRKTLPLESNHEQPEKNQKDDEDTPDVRMTLDTKKKTSRRGNNLIDIFIAIFKRVKVV